MEFAVGDRVRLKKTHPCGNHEWEILRVGMDFRIRCCGCGRLVMLPRRRFEQQVRQRLRHPASGPETGLPPDTV